MITITYPVSLKYRQQWGLWELTREFYQNHIDAVKANAAGYRFSRVSDDTIKMSDDGKGFELHHLMIGESGKDGVETIGIFGEGMKFALLVALREGLKVVITSHNIQVVPKVTSYSLGNSSTEIMALDVDQVDVSIKGTETLISGDPEKINKIFGFLHTHFLPDPMTERVVTASKGQLFIKGIFVKEIKSFFSYNLNARRESITDGSIDDYTVRYVVARILSRDPKNLLALYKYAYDENIEPGTFYEQALSALSECSVHDVQHQYWGTQTKLFRVTDPQLAKSAEYKKYGKAIMTKFDFEVASMVTDVELLKSHTPLEGTAKVKSSTMSDRKRAKLAAIRHRCKRIFRGCPAYKVYWAAMEADTLGKNYLNVIYLNQSLKYEEILPVFLHEFTHLYKGSHDLTSQFEQDLMEVALRYSGAIR